MTSREAFESLIKNYKPLKKFKGWDGVEFDKILKDLEIAEKLKEAVEHHWVIDDILYFIEEWVKNDCR